MVDLQTIDRIKKLTIISLVQDDELMESLVLKGGNAISMGYGLGNRASYDLDFSLEEDFEDILEIQARLEKSIAEGFAQHALHAFDVRIFEKPKTQHPDLQQFWGGYAMEFKVIEMEKYEAFEGNLETIRRNAMVLNPNNSTRFMIDISKFEYVGNHKKRMEIDGIYFYIYAPELIVFEKVRALAQKLPEYYRDILLQEKLREEDDRARARDFYDIYEIMQHYPIDLSSPDTKTTLGLVFEAKKVPSSYLRRIREMQEVHRQDYSSVIDTMGRGADDKGFDFYFGYFIENFEHLLD